VPAGKPAVTASKPAAPAGKPVVTAQSGSTTAASNGKTAAKTGSAPAKKAEAKPQSSPVTVKSTAPATPAKSSTPAKAEAKPATKTPAVIAVKPQQGAPAKKTGTTQTKAQAKPATPAPAPKVTQSGPVAKAEEKPKPVTRAYGAHGRRDPFVSPIRERSVNGPLPNCTSGKRCLAIPELVLQGTVKDTSGKMMAVVANSTKKTYFLRENDQVFNGSVEKITSDSIIFREYGKDALGRETAREVVKKLVPTS
jgi:Tfp pilus assembly protein PilP